MKRRLFFRASALHLDILNQPKGDNSMTKVTEDLKAAFSGESQANRRYLAYAATAEREGHDHIAKLFRAVAAAETIHAHNHLRTLGGIKDTEANLKEAMGGENYEVVSMYPEFIADAEEEGHRRAATTFRWAWEVEKIHEQLYREALENLDEGPPEETPEYWVCSACGHTHVGDEPPEECPICGAKRKQYLHIE